MIPVEFIEHPSIGPPIVVNLIEGQHDVEEEIMIRPEPEQSDYGYDTPWLPTIRAYITEGKLPTIRQPAKVLSSSRSTYPFMHWAMDIVGPLHNSKQKCFLLVLTDFFSKWVEADSYASKKDVQVENFVWKNII